MPKNDGKGGKRLGSAAYVFVALFLLSFSILLFSTRSFVIDIKDTGLSVFSGVRGGVYAITSFISQTVNSITELTALREEHGKLLEKLARYEEIERKDTEIREENYRLREQLGFSQELRYKHIPAEIIGRDPDNLFQALVLNKGSAHGVKKDMPVITYQDGVEALAGKITQVARYESLLLPLYDEHCFVSSRFAQSRYEGMVSGMGTASNPLVMQFIEKRAREIIQKGDSVVSSGIGGVYPAGVNVGRVTAVLFGEDNVRVDVEPAVNFSKLEYVFVLEREETPSEADHTFAPAAASGSNSSND